MSFSVVHRMVVVARNRARGRGIELWAGMYADRVIDGAVTRWKEARKTRHERNYARAVNDLLSILDMLGAHNSNKHSDVEYLRYDPFEGDRDVKVRMRFVKLVHVRLAQKCHGLDRETHGHKIAAGERARFEKALVEGRWGSYYVCLGCMDKWLST